MVDIEHFFDSFLDEDDVFSDETVEKIKSFEYEWPSNDAIENDTMYIIPTYQNNYVINLTYRFGANNNILKTWVTVYENGECEIVMRTSPKVQIFKKEGNRFDKLFGKKSYYTMKSFRKDFVDFITQNLIQKKYFVVCVKDELTKGIVPM